MAGEQMGVSPASSRAIIECVLRTLSARGAFGQLLDPSLEALARRLAATMPSHLFPDTYLMQPLGGDAPTCAAFALDAYERAYLERRAHEALVRAVGGEVRVRPEDRDVVCGTVATGEGEWAFAEVDDSVEARSLKDAGQRAAVCAALGCPAGADSAVGRFLERVASLPLRYRLRGQGGRGELVVLLPRTAPSQRFENAPFREALCDALGGLGVDVEALAGLARACVRVGVPCDVPGCDGMRWLASVDVALFSLSFRDGGLAGGMAGIRVTDRTTAFLHTTLRPVRSYQWHITEYCDQRCRHCYLFAEGARAGCTTMPIDDLLRTLDRIEGRCAAIHAIPELNITGGDPLLHPHFWEFAEELHRRGFVWTVMGNPFHLTPETCERLRGLGCARYQLSLDGRRAYHDSLRKPGSFDATIAAARLLRQAGVCVQLMATVSRQNMDEILPCMDIADELGVDYFAFARYCATSPDKAAELYPTPQEYRSLLLAYHQRRRVLAERGSRCEFRCKDHLFVLLEHELGEFEVPAWSAARPDVVCGGCHLAKQVTILANGDLVACPRMDSVVGNLHTDDLATVESGQAMRAYRDVRRIEGCRDCELLMWCRGCRAVGFGATHDAWAADPMCWRHG